MFQLEGSRLGPQSKNQQQSDAYTKYLWPEDFANQVKYGVQYRQACEMAGLPVGRFVTPAAGEFVSGI